MGGRLLLKRLAAVRIVAEGCSALDGCQNPTVVAWMVCVCVALESVAS